MLGVSGVSRKPGREHAPLASALGGPSPFRPRGGAEHPRFSVGGPRPAGRRCSGNVDTRRPGGGQHSLWRRALRKGRGAAEMRAEPCQPRRPRAPPLGASAGRGAACEASHWRQRWAVTAALHFGLQLPQGPSSCLPADPCALTAASG